MSIETIKHIIVYFLVFVLIIGLTSVFIVKDFMGQAREIELQGKDMLNMQLTLNNGNLTREEKKVEEDREKEMDIIITPTIEDKNRETYKKGDTGEEVREFQEILYELDFLRSNLDGNFGPMTEEALKDFQKFKGLEETGELDIETQKALENAKEKENLKDDPQEQIPQPKGERENRIHFVKSGENLYIISQIYNVPVEDICRENNITESSILNIGQELIIP